MKKRILCAFSLILYLLLACLILSLKIEEEMTTQVEVYTAKALGLASSRVTLPARILFEGDSATDLTLYEVVEGTGWEAGLRLREVPRYLWSLKITSATDWEIEVPREEGRRYVLSASRHPQEGDPAQIIARFEKADDVHLAIYLPPKVLPEALQLPENAEVLGRSEQALLLKMTNANTPFFEHKAKGMSLTTDYASRIFSLTAVKQLFEQLPSVTAVFLILAAGLIFCLHGCCMSIRPEEHKVFLGVDILLAVALLLLAKYVLGGIDLPSSLLPQENILQLSHYREELSLIFTALEDFPEAARDLTAAKEQSLSGCRAAFWGVVLGTAAVLLPETAAILRKHKKEAQ